MYPAAHTGGARSGSEGKLSWSAPLVTRWPPVARSYPEDDRSALTVSVVERQGDLDQLPRRSVLRCLRAGAALAPRDGAVRQRLPRARRAGPLDSGRPRHLHGRGLPRAARRGLTPCRAVARAPDGERPSTFLTGRRPQSRSGKPHRDPGSQLLLPTSGVATGRPSVNSPRKAAFTNSGAPRVYETQTPSLRT